MYPYKWYCFGKLKLDIANIAREYLIFNCYKLILYHFKINDETCRIYIYLINLQKRKPLNTLKRECQNSIKVVVLGPADQMHKSKSLHKEVTTSFLSDLLQLSRLDLIAFTFIVKGIKISSRSPQIC